MKNKPAKTAKQPLRIDTERLLIRHLSPDDLTDFHSYRSKPKVAKYQGFDVMNLAQAEAFIQDNAPKYFGKAGEWVQYGIESKLTGKLIGDCAIKLDLYDVRMAEVGITISPKEQKKGYAKEALSAILKFLFSIENFHRVSETVDVDNKASIQLLKSLGFRQEGHFVENSFFKGKWSSEFRYAMLKREWDERRPSYDESQAVTSQLQVTP